MCRHYNILRHICQPRHDFPLPSHLYKCEGSGKRSVSEPSGSRAPRKSLSAWSRMQRLRRAAERASTRRMDCETGETTRSRPSASGLRKSVGMCRSSHIRRARTRMRGEVPFKRMLRTFFSNGLGRPHRLGPCGRGTLRRVHSQLEEPMSPPSGSSSCGGRADAAGPIRRTTRRGRRPGRSLRGRPRRGAAARTTPRGPTGRAWRRSTS